MLPMNLQQELQALGVRAASLEVDLSIPEAPTFVLDTVEAQLGNLSILVNNAAYSVCEKFGYDLYPISYRHLEEMMCERGVEVDHSTLYRFIVLLLPKPL